MKLMLDDLKVLRNILLERGIRGTFPNLVSRFLKIAIETTLHFTYTFLGIRIVIHFH
jgi:hypothetical protein